MKRRIEIGVLALLLAVIALLAYRYWRPAPEAAGTSPAYGKFEPLAVENPSLRLDMLERIRKFAYPGGQHRNIFVATLPPPPPSATQKKAQGPVAPPPPPPLEVPAKFFGYAADLRTGVRRAFFASPDGENVYILAEGETLLGRFRLLRIGNSTAEVEEIASGRRATLVMEEQVPPA